ncbi:MAG: DsbA family protein [Alphaproteobacteria bacterium]|nr:DsbA family protein [Alphaproteobacteria bacterium]
MTGQKKNNNQKTSALPIITAVLVVLGIILIAGLYASNKKIQNVSQQSTATEASAPAQNEESIKTSENAATPPIHINPAVSRVNDNPYSARILGDPNAPLKISEHSAFTCGHCKHFHETNYIKIKRDYIDTGKAYLVYNDFPLSDVGIKVGAVARCLPDQVYFNFVQLMFETQDQWKSYEKYIPYMKQNTRLLGLSEEKFEECLNSEEIHKIITDVQENAHKTHDVKSTPTLVLNDSIVIMGLTPYPELRKTFDSLIAEAQEKKSTEEIPEVIPEDTSKESDE